MEMKCHLIFKCRFYHRTHNRVEIVIYTQTHDIDKPEHAVVAWMATLGLAMIPLTENNNRRQHEQITLRAMTGAIRMEDDGALTHIHINADTMVQTQSID